MSLVENPIAVFEITPEILELQKTWSEFKGNEFSIRKDEFHRFVSDIAEIVFQQTYPDAKRVSEHDTHADFILKGKRIDVKCKDRTVDATLDFDAAVEARQKDFNVDWYIFYSYNRKTNMLQFMGWISKEDYYKKAMLFKKGEMHGSNNWVVSVDCYNLKCQELIR